MNSETCIQLLKGLNDTDWNALLEDSEKALVMVNDAEVVVDSAKEQSVIFPVTAESKEIPSFSNAQELRSFIINNAEALLEAYYRTHPLGQQSFDQQVTQLIEKLGYQAFTALQGNYPDYSLFVDSATVVAEARGNPRHPYGAYLELERELTGDALKARVIQWLLTAQAYERYLSMNTCRYSC